MENKDKKEYIVKALAKAYEWAKGKGWNETVIKVVLGAIFGVAAAFLLSSCSLGYESTSQRLNVEILPVESWTK
jgi:hypothetical protein